ncbi:Protein SDA1 [Trichinella spiralis]|uniref:Protein SDA1 n=1 Tax=Trichinella spiralis TaxID=6334 RepID=A0ABR3KZ09_TRISP
MYTFYWCINLKIYTTVTYSITKAFSGLLSWRCILFLKKCLGGIVGTMPSDKMRQNLSILQEQLVRDPASYRDEFIEQYRHFESLLSLAEMQPQVKSERLLEILVDTISRSAQTVQPALRLGICKALLLLHGKLSGQDIAAFFVHGHDKQSEATERQTS